MIKFQFFCYLYVLYFFLDKSLGDTSDIISDSSGVGTNSDSAACSIGHPSTTVVCFEAYTPSVASTQNNGHLTINPGDVIEVVGSTDCGLLEGFVRGTNRTGFFPATCVQEVQFRQQKGALNMVVGHSSSSSPSSQYASTSTLIIHGKEPHHHQQVLQLDGNGNNNNSIGGITTISHKVSSSSSHTLTPTDKKRYVFVYCLPLNY